ncbi:hypothetical protein G5I_07209 [Acromyrmex echinatior]|uniref:Uncharacterized protein n=1 Tax=Acromyrmex echinatior TaxID=103372 RepID=F4WN61_ACREC|nr:hypothetical protein G5I_07209 [Acromyrmex echinatior]
MSSQCCQKQKRSDSRVSDSETYLSGEISAHFEIGDIHHDSSSGKIWTTIDYNVATAKSMIDKGRTDFRMSACPPIYKYKNYKIENFSAQFSRFCLCTKLSQTRDAEKFFEMFEKFEGTVEIAILSNIYTRNESSNRYQYDDFNTNLTSIRRLIDDRFLLVIQNFRSVVTGLGCCYHAPCKGMSQSHTEIEMESTTVAIKR